MKRPLRAWPAQVVARSGRGPLRAWPAPRTAAGGERDWMVHLSDCGAAVLR